MALKNGLNIEGIGELQDTYINIDTIKLFKKNKKAEIIMSAYKDESFYRENKPAIPGKERIQFFVKSEAYDAYFSDEVLKPVNKTIESQVYMYLKNLTEFSSFEDVIEI